jgi:hypothetical protein
MEIKLLTDWAKTQKFYVHGRETGEKEETPHLQIYVELTKQMTIVAINKIIKGKKGGRWIHCEARKGGAEEAAGYCMKGECSVRPTPSWAVFYYNPHKSWQGVIEGNITQQGTRHDLEEKKDQILRGEVTVDELTVESPMLVHMYGRTLDRIEAIALRQKFRTTMTRGTWIHGPTGVGKSHTAFQDYSPDTHYLWKTQTKWQDGYKGQGIVIINDFRGEIPYNQLLQLLDKWPFDVERRGKEVVPFLAQEIIITSSLTPQQVYRNREVEDSLEQLLRRLEVKHLTNCAHKYSEGSNQPLSTFQPERKKIKQ